MQIKVKQTTETTLEVKIPMYVESPDSGHKYAILSKDRAISVYKSRVSTDTSIQDVPIATAFHGGFKEITAFDFCTFYQKVATDIYNECNSFLDHIEERRIDALETPRPDMDYPDDRQQEIDKFADKSNDYHERQMEAQYSSEPGIAW